MSADPSRRRGLSASWHARHHLFLALLFALEALVFYTQVADQISPFFAASWDQVSFYNASYELLFERFRTSGWSAFIEELLYPRDPRGAIFPSLGALSALIGGPNRAAMLSVNLVAFLALQWVLFHTVLARTREIGFPWIAIALLLSCGTIFNRAGGWYDFRIDFPALCLYGIWTCLIVRSRVFRDRKRVLVIAAVAVLLVSLRFFTVIYVAEVLGGLLLGTVVAMWRGSSPFRRAVAALRARNILISGALTAAVSLPLLLAAGKLIYGYYAVGHVLSEEKYIRAREYGVHSIIDHLLYYPRTIRDSHVGADGRRLGGVLVALFALGAWWPDRARPKRVFESLWRFRLECWALALAIVGPLAVLTVDISKSPVAGGVVVVPALLMVVLVCAGLRSAGGEHAGEQVPLRQLVRPAPWRRPGETLRSVARGRIVVAAGTFALAVGLASFVGRASAPQRPGLRSDLERVNALNGRIVRFAVENAIATPTVSIDRVVDYLHAGTLRMSAFESSHRLIQFAGLFGDGIFGAPREVALKLFAESDIIVLTDPVRDREWPPYPINTKVREYWNDLWVWTNQNRVMLLSTDIFGLPHWVFVKPWVRLSGGDGGWVTSGGLRLEVDGGDVARWPFIVLSGEANYRWLGGEPRPKAVVVDPVGRRGTELPVKLKARPARPGGALGTHYELVIDAKAVAESAGGKVSIALTFDRFFVPRELGINSDTRELVVRIPASRDMLRSVPE